MAGSGKLVPSKEFVDLEQNMLNTDIFANSTDLLFTNRLSPNGRASTKTLFGLVKETSDAIENTIGKSYVGVWTQSVTTFNFMNEYAEFNGVTYKPKSGITLPYVAQTSSPLTPPDSDNVEPFSDINSSNISNAEILSSGSTEPRTLGDRFADTANVKDDGAVGDGVTDDTVAFRDCWERAKIIGSMYIPSGTYMLTNKESIISDSGDLGITVFGDGLKSTIITREFSVNIPGDPSGDYTASGAIFDFPTGVKNITFRDIGFLGYNSITGDPNIPPNPINTPSYYNSSGTSINIINDTPNSNSIENIQIENIDCINGYSPIYIESKDSTAKNVHIKNVFRSGGYYGMLILGVSSGSIDGLFIREGTEMYEIHRGMYFSSTDFNISNINISSFGSTGIFLRSFGSYNVRNVSISNVNIRGLGGCIQHQSDSGTSVQGINIANVVTNTVTRNPNGGISFLVDAGVVAPVIKNVNIVNWTSNGIGIGLYFGSINSEDSVIAENITISNVSVGADGIVGVSWLRNGSDEHGALGGIIKSLTVKGLRVVVPDGSTGSTLELRNFNRTSIEMSSNSQSPVILSGNRMLDLEVGGGVQPTIGGEFRAVLVNGALLANTIVYSDAGATYSDSITGETTANPLSPLEVSEELSWLSDKQRINSVYVSSILCKGDYVLSSTDLDGIHGITFDQQPGQVYSLISDLPIVSSSSITIKNANVQLIILLDCSNILVQSSTFLGSNGVRATSSDIHVLNCDFPSVTNAFIAIKNGANIFANGNTGTSTVAYYAEFGGTITYRGSDTLTGTTDTPEGGVVTSY